MSELRDSITIAKTIPARVHDDYGSVIVGGNDVAQDGRWVLGVGIHDRHGDRDIEGLVEGDSIEFAGASWQVTKIYEPDTEPRGLVAELTRVSDPQG